MFCIIVVRLSTVKGIPPTTTPVEEAVEETIEDVSTGLLI